MREGKSVMKFFERTSRSIAETSCCWRPMREMSEPSPTSLRARAKAREYNKAHRAELREYYQKWRAEHPGAQKEYYRQNRERELAKARAYREAHRAEINARARARYAAQKK